MPQNASQIITSTNNININNKNNSDSISYDMDISPTNNNNDTISFYNERILKRQGSSLYNNSSKHIELDINQLNNLKKRASLLYNDFPKRLELVNDE